MTLVKISFDQIKCTLKSDITYLAKGISDNLILDNVVICRYPICVRG